MSSEFSSRLITNDENQSRTKSTKERLTILVVLIAIVVSIIVGVSMLSIKTPSGLPSSHREEEASYEKFQKSFLDNVSAKEIKETMKFYSSKSHIAGSPSDYEQALETKKRLEGYGIKTKIEEVPVLLNYPLKRRVVAYESKENNNKLVYECELKESVVDDGTSSLPAIDTFNGYSGDGNVIGELVYANYGTEEDYIELEKKNIDLNGKIVIVRYGKIFRGNKVTGAQKRGAKGVLIYTDPSDSGNNKGKVYKEGPWSTNTTVQRGTIWTGRGDPLSPGWPSDNQFYVSLNLSDARNDSIVNEPLPLIPVQPISYGDAYPLLINLNNNEIPNESWQGGLNFTYKIGPGPIIVNIEIKSNYTVTNIWNVIGTIEGKIEKDRYIIVGAHRDAWTFGSGDPISGTSTLLETARVFGILLSNGYQPRRSIVFCSWDAEEYGLIGSVEFVEKHYNLLYNNAVVYLNSDISVSGTDHFNTEGSPNLFSILNDVTNQVTINGNKVNNFWDKKMGYLGDGSDYTGFYQHLGISSLDSFFSNDNRQYYSVYHSNYDSFYWYSHFGDPDFTFHSAYTKLFGLLTLHFANNRLLPFDTSYYSSSLLIEITNLNNTYSNLTHFDNMFSSVQLLEESITKFNKEIELAKNYDATITTSKLRSINDRLMKFERSFLVNDKELTGREWYQHIISAPSKVDAYAGEAFPTLKSALRNNKINHAKFLEQRIAIVIKQAADSLKSDLFV